MKKQKQISNPYNYGTQLWKVFNHLQKKGSITQVEAEAVYKIRRLASRISEMKFDGIAIEKMNKHDMAGQRYTRYALLNR